MASSTVASPPKEFRIERFAPGESVRPASVEAPERFAAATTNPSVARPGDFILTHSAGFIGSLIRFGEWLRYWGKDKIYAHWSHAAIFVDNSGSIVEALGGGVQKGTSRFIEAPNTLSFFFPTIRLHRIVKRPSDSQIFP